MRLTSKNLAEALLNVVEAHPRKVNEICENFIAFLRINRRLASLPLVLKNLREVADDKFGIKQVTVVSRFPLSKDAEQAIERLVIKRTGARNVTIEQQLNEDLVAGARVYFDDTVVDVSILTQIQELVR